jgi:tRNA pseudouridine38-40 synthase
LKITKKYKIIVAYDGTDFSGWQVQKNQRSVANTFENIFYAIFKHEIRLIGASRTDAGVHAQGQVATFSTDLAVDPHHMKHALNRGLPSSVVLRSLEEIDPSFHPRYDVAQKTYWYHFFTQPPLPWMQRYGYYIQENLDLVLLEQALQIFVGTHDFRSFCTGSDLKDTVRTVDTIMIDFNPQFTAHRIVVKGKGFLRYMIRRMVGACFAVAQGALTLDSLRAILQEKDAHQKLLTAPAQGLMLYEIIYK